MYLIKNEKMRQNFQNKINYGIYFIYNYKQLLNAIKNKPQKYYLLHLNNYKCEEYYKYLINIRY